MEETIECMQPPRDVSFKQVIAECNASNHLFSLVMRDYEGTSLFLQLMAMTSIVSEKLEVK